MGVEFFVDHPITGWRTSCAFDQTVYPTEAAAQAAARKHPANGCARAFAWEHPYVPNQKWQDLFDAETARLGLPPDYCTMGIGTHPIRENVQVTFTFNQGRRILEALGYVNANGQILWQGRDTPDELLGRALVATALIEDVPVPSHTVTGAAGARVLYGPDPGIGEGLTRLIRLAEEADGIDICWC